MSEWFKEPVLKTGDSKEPWVRIPPSPPIEDWHKRDSKPERAASEKKTIDNCFQRAGAKTGTANRVCGRRAEQIAKQAVSHLLRQ